MSVARRWWLASLLGGGIGYLLNLLPVTVWNGATLVFGGVASLAVALRLGPTAGAIAAAIAFLPTLTLWEQPIALGLAVGEAILIGRSKRRLAGGDLERLHATLLWYWVAIGAPLLAAWYLGVRGVAAWAVMVVIAKSMFNAQVVLGLARLAALIPRLGALFGVGREAERHPLRMQEYLLGVSALGIALPALLLVLLLTRQFERAAEQNDALEVQRLARATATAIGAAVEERVSGIAAVAAILGHKGAPSAELAQQVLSAAGEVTPTFVTMLVTDADGTIVAGHGGGVGTVAALKAERFNVSDREYFTEARDRRRPFVSDVLRGRGFGNARIVAISAPILDDAGRFHGVVEGSIDANDLSRFVGVVPEQFDVTLLSATGRIILASDTLRSPPLALASEAWAPLRWERPFRREPPYSGTTLERRDEPRRPISIQTRFVATDTTPAGWTVRADRSLGESHREVRAAGLSLLVVSLLAVFLLRLLFQRVLRDILRPLDALEEAARQVTSRSEHGEHSDEHPVALAPALGPSTPVELRQLVQDLDAMRRTLHQRLQDLRLAVAQRDSVNRTLAQTMEGLEATVASRTADLSHALDEARKATQVKTDFLASMSHELRTPLNAVMGSIDALREEVHGPVSAKQALVLEAIGKSAEHLLALINDILDMERIAAGRMTVRSEKVDVRRALDQLLATASPLAERAGLTLSTELPAGTLWMQADPLRLQQVLMNLVGNAIKFTPEGGRVTVRAKLGHQPGRVIEIAVEDTGIGIAPEDQERIFEPFSQVEAGHTRRYGGTGLGLGISRALAEAMGCSLQVQSARGHGSTFTLRSNSA